MRRAGGRRVNKVSSLPIGQGIPDCLIRRVTFIYRVKCALSAVLINANQDTEDDVQSYSAYTWGRVMPDFNHVRLGDLWDGKRLPLEVGAPAKPASGRYKDQLEKSTREVATKERPLMRHVRVPNIKKIKNNEGSGYRRMFAKTKNAAKANEYIYGVARG